jgi:hypothetical protein
VTDHEVQLATDMTAMFRKLDHAHGAGWLRQQVVNYLATDIGDLLSRPTTDPHTERALMTVTAGTCELAGYQAIDIGADGLAQRYYLAALGFAQASGDRAYGAHLVAVNIAHLALHVGYPIEALRMVRAAQHGAHRTSPTARASLSAVAARVHSRLKDEKACTASLIAAEGAMSEPDPGDEPDWISYFTPADLEDEMAHCMHDLGHDDRTQHVVRGAVADLDRSRVRRLAIDTALLATSLARSGEVDEACSVARDAVDYSSRTRSHRSELRIHRMRKALRHYADNPEVIALEQYIREMSGRPRSGDDDC